MSFLVPRMILDSAAFMFGRTSISHTSSFAMSWPRPRAVKSFILAQTLSTNSTRSLERANRVCGLERHHIFRPRPWPQTTVCWWLAGSLVNTVFDGRPRRVTQRFTRVPSRPITVALRTMCSCIYREHLQAPKRPLHPMTTVSVFLISKRINSSRRCPMRDLSTARPCRQIVDYGLWSVIRRPF